MLQITFMEAEFETEKSEKSQKHPIVCKHIYASQWDNCTGGLGIQTCGFRPIIAPDWVTNEGLR